MLRRPRFLALAALLGGCATAPAAPSTSAERPPFTVTVTGTGRPVVFLTDLEVSGEVWDSTLAHLGGRVEAHVIQVAGFAGQPAVPGPLVPKLRDALALYLHQHAPGAILVGHMFGAELAYWLAMTEPDVVGGIVTIDAPPSRNDGSIDPEAEEVRQALVAATPELYAKMATRRLGSMMADQALAKKLVERAVHSSPTAVADCFWDMMSRDLRSQIPNIKAPTLVLLTTGNLPPAILPAVEQAYREQLAPIPQHELVVVPGARHYVMFDAPEVYFAQLDRFLAAHPGR